MADPAQRVIEDIKAGYYRADVPFALMQQLGRTPKKKVQQILGATGK